MAGLVYMTGLAACLDQIKGWFLGDAPEGAEFPAADAVAGGAGGGRVGPDALPPFGRWRATPGFRAGARVAVFAGAGLWLGQVANPAAHELIHRPGRGLFRLGALVYCWLLFGHHTSAHRLVHHRHAASAQDPNTARSGEGYYAFLLRAWGGSFRRGWAAEDALRERGKAGVHPYAVYIGVAVFCLGLGYAIAGVWGSLAWAALAAHAQSQLMLSDYVQHYGLMRAVRPDGRLEPCRPATAGTRRIGFPRP